MRWAFLTTGSKSLLALAGPLLSLTEVTSCVLSSAPIVRFRKRLVLVFMVSPLLLTPLLLPDLPLHRREDVPLDSQGVVAGDVAGEKPEESGEKTCSLILVWRTNPP